MVAVSFDLAASGLAPGALRVASLEGEEGLSRPYRFEIEAVSDDPNLSVETLLGKPATLNMRREGDERQIHGVLAEIEEGGVASGGVYGYRLVLVPRLWLLTLSRHNRTFGTVTPISVVDVVSAVLGESDGLALGETDFTFRLAEPGAYPARPFWAQYNESDLDFISRLLEHWGISYYFEQGGDAEKLVFVDSNLMMPRQEIDGDLPYDSRAGVALGGHGIAQSLRRRLRPVPKQARLKDYNYELPQLALETTQPIDNGTFGEYVEYAAHFRDPAEGNVLARARAEELGRKRDVFEIATDSLFVSAGQLFSLSAHFRRSLNQEYLPVTVRHFGEQPLAGAYAEGGGADVGYRNEVTAIPAETTYRPERCTPRPKMPQLMPALVDAEDALSERAMLDAQGRYKVAMNFDMTHNPAYKRSAFLRMAQPYGGPEAGFHFPLRKDTEVLLGWRDGDPDRPLILSAVPNPLTSSPVTQRNHTENKIQTPSGMTLVMNDGPAPGGSGGNAPAAQAGPAPAPAAGGGQNGTDKIVSVYMAYTVPADNSDLPHYWRLGAIVPGSDSDEAKIFNSKLFGAGSKDHRPTERTDANYAGFFSYTPDNVTVTVGGDLTVVTGRDRRADIGGGEAIKVGGSRHVLVEGEANETTHIPHDTVLKYDGTFSSGLLGHAFTLERRLGVDISYGATVNYDANVNYTLRTGLDFNCESAPSFTYSFFPSYNVWPSASWLEDINMDGNGCITYPAPSGFVDKSEIYATDKIVLGARSISGEPIQKMNRSFARGAQAAAAVAHSAFAFDAELIGENAKKLKDPDYDPKAQWTDTMSEIMSSSVLPTAVSAVDAAVAGRMVYYNKVAKKALEAASDIEPTITIDSDGIQLQYGPGNIISIGRDGISITGSSISLFTPGRTRILNMTDAGISASAGQSVVQAFDSGVQITSSNQVNIEGDTNITGGVTVNGTFDAVLANIGL